MGDPRFAVNTVLAAADEAGFTAVTREEGPRVTVELKRPGVTIVASFMVHNPAKGVAWFDRATIDRDQEDEVSSTYMLRDLLRLIAAEATEARRG